MELGIWHHALENLNRRPQKVPVVTLCEHFVRCLSTFAPQNGDVDRFVSIIQMLLRTSAAARPASIAILASRKVPVLQKQDVRIRKQQVFKS